MPESHVTQPVVDVTSSTGADASAIKTLVVDDDALLLEAMCAQLRVLGTDADAAATRTAAIELLTRTTYDLVFLDTQMPDLTEADVLAAIADVGGRTDVVVMSGLRRTAPPNTTFLLKPVSLSDIRTRVDDANQRALAASRR